MRNNFFEQYQHKLKQIPRRYWVIGGVLLALVLYSLVFFIPKNVTFSYAGPTCARQLVLFPSIQKTTSEKFTVSIKDELKIGSFAWAATKVCAEANEAPVPGEYAASVRPFGGVIMAKPLSIKVSDPPVARQSDLAGKAISTVLPLKITLTSPDTIHTYAISVADKEATCVSKEALLECSIEPLALTPGQEYKLALTRSYKDTRQKVLEGGVKTLLPIALTEASLTDGKVIYDSPKEFQFTFDHDVTEADVALQTRSGEAPKVLDVTTKTNGKVLIVTLGAELARKTDYTLTLKQVVASNGSSLVAPVALNFTASGGPKPSAVSVGATNVPQNAQITVTLDQPIKEGVDIAQFARVEGINGGVSKRSATELVFSVQGGLCQAFSLVLKEGIASGSNTAVSEPWKYDARTICGTSSVIGYSAKGRPIIAYYFGNGGTNLLFTGGMHGSEPSGYSTMQALVNHFMAYGYTIPSNKRVVIVPNTNPDGIAAGSRNSATNVNIGRNFPTANWKANIETTSGVLVNGGGASAGSEPETKALMSLTRQLRPRLEVSYHAQGRLVGANKFGDSVSIGDQYARTVGYQTMFYDAEAVMGYPMTGEYEDWMGEEMGIPAILIELPTHSGNYISSQLSAINKLLSL